MVCSYNFPLFHLATDTPSQSDHTLVTSADEAHPPLSPHQGHIPEKNGKNPLKPSDKVNKNFYNLICENGKGHCLFFFIVWGPSEKEERLGNCYNTRALTCLPSDWTS